MDTAINKDSRCAVIGHGSWATALVKVLTMNELSVGWFVHNPEVFESLQHEGHNCRYLTDLEFDMSRIRLSNDVNETIGNADIVFLVMPAAYLNPYLSTLTVSLKDKFVVSAIKGIIPNENQFVTDYLKKTYGLYQWPDTCRGSGTWTAHLYDVSLLQCRPGAHRWRET